MNEGEEGEEGRVPKAEHIHMHLYAQNFQELRILSDFLIRMRATYLLHVIACLASKSKRPRLWRKTFDMNRVPKAGAGRGGGRRAQGGACEKRSNLVYPIYLYINMGVSDKPFTTPPILSRASVSSKARGPRYRSRLQTAIPPAAAAADGAHPRKPSSSRL